MSLADLTDDDRERAARPMNARTKRLASGGARLPPIVANHAFGLACGLAGVKVTTWLVPPAAYGRFGVFASLAPLGMWVVHAGLVKFVNRHWAATPDRGALLREIRPAFIRKLPWLALATALAAAALDLRRWPVVFPLLFVTATLLSWGALAQGALQAARQHWRDFALSGAASVMRSFAPPLLFWASGGIEPALYCGYLGHALVLAAAGTWAVLAGLSRPPAPPAGTILTPVYEGPLFIALAVNGWAMAGLQRWIAAGFFGAAEAGYVALAANFSVLVPAMLGTIALQYFQPEFFAAATDTAAGRRELARRVDRIALVHAILSVVGLLALRALMPSLVGPLVRESYRPAIALLLPTGGAMLALATGWFYHSLLLAGRRERACGPAELTAAAVLTIGSVGAATAGVDWWRDWCMVSPLVPWIVNRPMARRYFLRPDADPGPARGP